MIRNLFFAVLLATAGGCTFSLEIKKTTPTCDCKPCKCESK